MKLWQRHLLFRLLFRLLLLNTALLSLYVLVDLSVNGLRFFNQQGATLPSILLYYLSRFAVHLDLFLPFSLLLSSLSLLFELNLHRELVALQVGGLSKRRLLSPFLATSLLLSLFSYANAEWFYAKAQQRIAHFEEFHPSAQGPRPPLYTLTLPDASQLIYRSFDEEKRTLFDLFWIRSYDEIWHIETLSLAPSPPLGHFVDRFVRKEKLEKQESFTKRPFPELAVDQNSPKGRPPSRLSHRPLSELLSLALLPSPDKGPLLTHLFHKLTRPLLCPLLLLALAPLAMGYSRFLRSFSVVSGSLFGFLAAFTILDGLVILGESRLLSPWIAVVLPLGVVGGGAVEFARKRL